jgi:Icc-related predicted phosphoesterase
MPGSFQYEDRAGAEGKGIPTFFKIYTHSGLNVGFEAIYKCVPRDTEILLTHTPPYGILDRASRGTHAGCQTLSTTLEELGQCRMHVFGHIHEAHGAIIHEGGGRVSVNAAMAGGYGQAVIVDLKHITNIM